MLTPSDKLLASTPALLTLLLLLLFAMPVESRLPLTPNVAWLMTVLVGMLCPLAWPRLLAFAAGLLQDVISGTPLGSQALIALILASVVAVNARRQTHQIFRVQWLEAAGTLVAAHFILWMLLTAMHQNPPALESMLLAGLVSGVWYPVFFAALRPLLARLPESARW